MMLMESDSTTTPRGLVDDWWAGLSLETGLYILIGLLALGVRMVQLGNAPLSAAEAHEALSAWRLVSMSSLPITQPISAAWYSLTSLTFLLLGASDFWARFWPMVAGVALVFTPVIFRRELGQSAALLASLLLALSPTLMAASRTVDGTTLAALGLVVTLAGLRQMGENPTGRGWLVTGLGLGLGLASGPRFVSGVAAGLIALILVVFVRPQVARSLRASWAIVRPQAGLALIASAVIFVVVGSGGLLVPSALSAAGVGLPTWLAGWVTVNDPRPTWLVPQLLVANEPLLVVMGLAGFYVAFLSGYAQAIGARLRLIFGSVNDGEGDPAPSAPAAVETPWLSTAIVLSGVALGALLFDLLYPARAASDALWVVIPLALLTGKVLAETFSGDWFEGELETVLAQAGVLFVMMVFAYFNLASYGKGVPLFQDRPIEFRLYLVAAVLGLGIFVTVMFGLGWSTLAAMRGAGLALSLGLMIGTLGSGLSLTLWRPADPNELWFTAPTATNVALLRQTLRDTSQRSTGKDEQLEVAVVNAPAYDDQNGVLGWELRNFPKAKFVDSLDLAIGGPAIIADSAISDPRLNSGYIGEKFPIEIRQQPADNTLGNLVNWWIYRDWPTDFSRQVVLWVRADVHDLLKQPGS